MSMTLAGTPIAMPEASSDRPKSIAGRGAESSIKKARKSDGRSFSTVLEQSKKNRQVDSNFGNEGTKARVFRRASLKFGKKLMGGNGLGELASKGEKLNLEIKKEVKHLGENRSKPRSKQRVPKLPSDASDQLAPALNEILQLVDAPNPKNRKKHDDSSVIRRTADDKHRSSLTSIAPRVEVEDRRIVTARADPIQRMRGIRRHLDRAGEDIEGEPRLENRPMTVDMEIEIPTRFEGKDSRRQVAMEFARKLDAQAGNEIVRQIKIVLNSDSAGELRINLKPDNLGTVRIQIQLEDNHLRGRFFVESAAAREVFKSALDGLQAKLLESGFEGADLEMAWDDASSDFWFNSANSRGRGAEDEALEFEKSVRAPIGLSDNLVNLVV